jgi:hypothetical protein
MVSMGWRVGGKGFGGRRGRPPRKWYDWEIILDVGAANENLRYI